MSEFAARLRDAVRASRGTRDGRVTDVYPALSRVNPGLRAAAMCGARPLSSAAGEGPAVPAAVRASTTAGDADAPFILMSVAKPLTLALAVDALGADAVEALTGMAESPYAFNDPAAITASPDGRTSPMVNPGAITVASLLGRGSVALGERRILDGLSRFAGRSLDADETMVDAIHASNHRNRLLAGLLAERRLLGCDLEDALHLYTLQSCVEVTVEDLARMGAVLAGGGMDPVTGARVVSAEAAEVALAAMTLAGLYEASASWRGTVGLPAKSGIAGGLVMVSPGVGALAAYSPPLDVAGNPVGAQAIARAVAPALRAPIA
ncbi:glutaminase [Demequina pelophila]|uniref:glutaminase n=1 Tax=Demequina pelophila TaxID=1638984 RepID=UPI00078169D5|nr:glutaminase [Demequina pelophila]